MDYEREERAKEFSKLLEDETPLPSEPMGSKLLHGIVGILAVIIFLAILGYVAYSIGAAGWIEPGTTSGCGDWAGADTC